MSLCEAAQLYLPSPHVTIQHMVTAHSVQLQMASRDTYGHSVPQSPLAPSKDRDKSCECVELAAIAIPSPLP